MKHNDPRVTRRAVLGATLSGTALACATPTAKAAATSAPLQAVQDRPTLIGSGNALAGMKLHYDSLVAGGHPLDVALEVVKIVEADPDDRSVGLGGLPNEDGVVQLDSAVMYGPTHNSGAVACIENILHPCEVARLVMERTDHCMIVGPGAYKFARMHGHPHTELLTESTREIWLRWMETHSEKDDRFPPAPKSQDEKQGKLYLHDGEYVTMDDLIGPKRVTGTIHCSALAKNGDVACTTTTSGLSWKVPGRVGDSPIIGAGLYCDQEAGSAGATGRGESAILSNGSAMIVELLRQGATPLDAGMEVLQRITRQAKRASSWQSALWGADDKPGFRVHFYVLGLDGAYAGVTLKGAGKFAVADPEGGPRHESLVSLH